MKNLIKKILFFIFIFIFILSIQITSASNLNISCESAIVIEQNTGRILYSKNIDRKRAMASTTKIMTAIVAIENGHLDDIITISQNAAEIEGSSIYLEANEHLTLEELLYGLMLRSGNDAAYAIAEYIGGGNVEKFINMMNRKAEEIGANNTHFMNPHGLHDKQHYTTAHDLAKITAYAMKNETFKKIISTKNKTISWENHEWNRSLTNKNKMLWNYQGGNGVKTGYTTDAGKCFVSSAFRNNIQLIAVVLKSNDIWKDATALLDYGFDHYKPYKVISKEDYLKSISVIEGTKDRIRTYSKKDVIIPIRKEEKDKIQVKIVLPEEIQAPVMREQIVGKLEVYVNNEKIDSTDIYVKDSIQKKSVQNMFEKFINHWVG
ncbi:D-alanyl-D-alanine carboxypeptidase (penicillin-binding protein 5/6) [Garciella nitratireducens DSM 15102]|uniref:serine-type D-Ala-D-Ala carboxypeptidase n=2 Tax=Garciella TaxID=218204 RepID=A0A1T4JUQ3_9FIRM|nr:D-alanyl-D-alanine carboxypeptidase (penicillin-binding protein 5/6) [Garciella nitratireducens DSM 15102]